MRVIGYEVHNIQKISEANFDLEGHNLFVIGGKNRQGKTSALTALLMALSGRSGMDDYPEIALVPYPVIVAASKGDPDAMKIVLQHFSGYIASLSMRKLYDERGNVYYGVDEDIRERLQARLMRAILTFRADE